MNLALLRLLADGKFHSGNALAESLDVSRTTVWKQIQYLESCGLTVNSVRGRGYRVPGGIALINKTRLESVLKEHLATACESFHLQVDLETDSTNLCAQRALAAGIKSGLFVAEYQTEGRGRRGRSWVSPLASNLYFSMILPFWGGVGAMEGLSLVVGLAVKRALNLMKVNGVEVKWPNDLLIDNRKLAGVLIEVKGDLSGDCNAVIGVGLNVNMPNPTGHQIDQPWIDLNSDLANSLDRTELLAQVVLQIFSYVGRFQETGFGCFIDEWQLANAHQNSEVEVIFGDRSIQGICLGVDLHGALRLATDQGERSFQGGELSLRAIR